MHQSLARMPASTFFVELLGFQAWAPCLLRFHHPTGGVAAVLLARNRQDTRTAHTQPRASSSRRQQAGGGGKPKPTA